MPDRSPAGRIDAHHHLWDLGLRDQPWIESQRMAVIRRSFDVAAFTDAVDGQGVARTVLVQVLNRSDETDELLDIAAGHTLIAGVVGWADLANADLSDELERLRRRGPLVGIRHQLQAEPAPAEWLQRADVRTGLRHVEAAGLVYDLMIRPEQFDAALEFVRARPGLRFVLDHLGKPPIDTGELEPWASGMQRLAREPNVTCKLSGLGTVADHRSWTVDDLSPYADVALAAFRPDRLMFGSDWPVCLLAAEYGELTDAVGAIVADLSPDERNDIWSGTARRVYSIS
jgi:L-fuconolactonase